MDDEGSALSVVVSVAAMEFWEAEEGRGCDLIVAAERRGRRERGTKTAGAIGI